MLNQPTAAVENFPAATAAAGCNLDDSDGSGDPPTNTQVLHLAEGTTPGVERSQLRQPTKFGHYLVATGALSDLQLRAAVAFHLATNIPIGAAAVRLGFISQPKVDRAAQSFHRRRHNQD